MKAYTPKPGFEWNPLRNHRNVACPCGSHKKAKRCHGRLDLMPIADIEKIRAYLGRLSAHGLIRATRKELGR